MEPPLAVQAELLKGSDITNGLPQVQAAEVLHQTRPETRASSRLASTVVRGHTKCLIEGPHLGRHRRHRPIRQGLHRGPDRDRHLQHPARWGHGLHLQRCTSGLFRDHLLRHRSLDSATRQLFHFFARFISRGRRLFRRAGTSSTTCRSVRRFSGTLRIARRLQLAGSSIRDRSCLTRRLKLHLFGGILIGRGPGTRVPLWTISSRPERSSLRYLAIHGQRWQRRPRSDLWCGEDLRRLLQAGRSDLLVCLCQILLLRQLCGQSLPLRRDRGRLRLRSRRQGLGLRVGSDRRQQRLLRLLRRLRQLSWESGGVGRLCGLKSRR